MIDRKFLKSSLRASKPPADANKTNYTALERQLSGAKEILARLRVRRGQILADDAGLGKTWTAALVALNIALNGGSVLVLVPNKGLQAKWIKDIGKVMAALPKFEGVNIRAQQRLRDDSAWRVKRSSAGSIIIASHASYGQENFPKMTADLLVVDEAHRSKNDSGVFKKKMLRQAGSYHAILFLTATPFSIRIDEFASMLDFVSGAQDADRTSALTAFDEFVGKANGGNDGAPIAVAKAEAVWRGAVAELQPWVMRETIDNLPDVELSYGLRKVWKIKIPRASNDVIEILVRTDRLLSLADDAHGLRGNDPRFHVGWQYLRMLLDPVPNPEWSDELLSRNRALRNIVRTEIPLAPLHAKKISQFLHKTEHAKINAVSTAIAEMVRKHEKVVVFCHHLATARELHDALKTHVELKDRKAAMRRDSVAFTAWEQAWTQILGHLDKDRNLQSAAMTFVTDASFRTQVSGWLSDRVDQADPLALARALRSTPVRLLPTREKRIPKIAGAVLELAQVEMHDDGMGGVMAVPQVLTKHRWQPTMISESDDLEAGLALFNTPFGPDVLIATDKLSEGVDLHRACRILVHYELDPSPIRVRQREGRVRRINGWAATVGKPVEYAYPAYDGTRDEALVRIIRDRLENFDLLLGGAPKVSDVDIDEAVAEKSTVFKLLQWRLGDEIRTCLSTHNGLID